MGFGGLETGSLEAEVQRLEPPILDLEPHSLGWGSGAGSLKEEGLEADGQFGTLITAPVWGEEGSLRVYVHETTLHSQNAEQLRENGWLRCSRTPQ